MLSKTIHVAVQHEGVRVVATQGCHAVRIQLHENVSAWRAVCVREDASGAQARRPQRQAWMIFRKLKVKVMVGRAPPGQLEFLVQRYFAENQ